ncbi:LysR family transcriptional regulator [Neisseria chenwenguii]|uniref:LysR family transcriptional regulator n=1 Tax=Neisseria chenwenguii TaxID=1853278 RepID=UPI000F501ADF|nr:LysR family transcriptional regulator [Neisseria chenwenguii]ROV56053.1 LysR family transcriptional regulator [Neisseria chenwenguii]
MDFKILHCLVELVRRQSFSDTAAALNLTQPTVSKMIQSLENELGVPLFHKENGHKKRRLELTPIGSEVYQHALNLLHERDLLLQRIDDYRQIKSGTLRIGLTLLGSDLLGNSFSRFHQKWPEIQLSFLEEGSLAIGKALRENEIDVGQMLAPVHEDFEFITLCDYPLMVIMPREKVRKQSAFTLRSLKHEPFILFGTGFSLNQTIQTACRQQGFTPNVICRTSQWNLLADMVGPNMGIALLPEYYANKMNPEVFAAVPLVEPEIRWKLTMAWKKHQRPAPALRAWLEIVRSEFVSFE